MYRSEENDRHRVLRIFERTLNYIDVESLDQHCSKML